MQFHRRWTFWTLICFSALSSSTLSTSVLGQDVKGPSSTEDKRLRKPVTIVAAHIYLSELLQRLSAQSGVDLTIDEQDTSSGVQVTCRCENVPLGIILDGLHGLVSSRDGDWIWRRSEHAGAFQYELREPNYAKERVNRWRSYVQKAFEDYIAVMIEFSEMTPEARQHNKPRLKQAIHAENEASLERLLSDEDHWKAVRLFAGAVPPAARLALLRDRKDFAAIVGDLSLQNQHLLHSVFASYHSGTATADGVVTPDPEPTTLKYSIEAANASDKTLVPDISIEVGEGASITFTGSACLEPTIFAAIKKAWMLPSDAVDNAASRRIIIANAQDIAKPLSDKMLPPEMTLPGGRAFRSSAAKETLETRLLQLSQDAALPVLMLLPPGQTRDFGSPTGQNVQAYLDKTSKDALHPMIKWRGNLLLVNYANWFVEEGSAVPYGLVKRYLRGRNGPIRLPELAKLTRGLNDAQFSGLAETFPVLQDALPLFPYLTLCGRFPAITSANGIPLDGETMTALPLSAREAIMQAVDGGAATALRLSQQISPGGKGSGIVIQVEVMAGDKWVSIGEFVQGDK